MASVLVDWLVRWGHVSAAAIWVGGHAVFAFAIVPALARRPDESLAALALACARLLSLAGTATIAVGLLLIWRTRGFASLLGGEWGGIVVGSLVLSVLLLGIGDSALRPAIRRLVATGDARPARRWALVSFALALVVVALMTRAPYARI